MQVLHRGLRIELPDDDPRVGVIETVLYGRPLPPPWPLPALPDTLPPPAPADPLVVVPEAWRFLWSRLKPAAREWLGKLAEAPVNAADVQRSLGARGLVGLHRHLAGRARGAGLDMPVQASGRGARRHYFLSPEALAHVRALAASPNGPSA